MATEIGIDGTGFLINGRPTYEGVSYGGRPVEGLLFNSRMVQAVFDDDNPETAGRWAYPDTGVWDPERNTDEFCAALPAYRRHGLLAVTVGLQGGGSIYEPEVYDHYVNNAFEPDGSAKPAYFERLRRVLAAADEAGMAVIVNYFYGKVLRQLEGDDAVRRAVGAATEWLLESDYRNILVDVKNEFRAGDGLVESENIHRLIEQVQQTTLGGRRLLASCSIHPENFLPPGRWQEVQDFYLPHGNSVWADQLRLELRRIKASDAYRANPRPLLMNEDSVYLESMDAAFEEFASWGYYSQGYGCGGWKHGRFDWPARGREGKFEDLSGFQTVPVNWGINTPRKRAFFDKVREITTGGRQGGTGHGG